VSASQDARAVDLATVTRDRQAGPIRKPKGTTVEDLSRRTAREVLDDHLNLANDWVDKSLDRILAEDLERNVAEDIVILINRGTFRGHEGVRQLAQMLSEELPGNDKLIWPHCDGLETSERDNSGCY
jgi:hypothetical protein